MAKKKDFKIGDTIEFKEIDYDGQILVDYIAYDENDMQYLWVQEGGDFLFRDEQTEEFNNCGEIVGLFTHNGDECAAVRYKDEDNSEVVYGFYLRDLNKRRPPKPKQVDDYNIF